MPGRQASGGDHADGYDLPLTMIADVDQRTALAQNEVFGPVLAVTPFDTEEEAIALANGTSYGLGAYIHTQNLRRAHHVASQMQAGMVQVNGSGEGCSPSRRWADEAERLRTVGRRGGLARVPAGEERVDESASPRVR